MHYNDVHPARLLSDGVDAPAVSDEPWLVRWDLLDDDEIHAVLTTAVPEVTDVWTSGSTGPKRRWQHTREQLWNEAGLLAELLQPQDPEAVLSFAPPRHIYGLLGSLLVPARMRLPVWYRPQFFGELPASSASRWAVIAVPWTFSILNRHEKWVLDTEHLAILHSTAMLPPQAQTLLHPMSPEQVTLTEIFGSTETGGIAWRSWWSGNDTWTLFRDVAYTGAPSGDTDEKPLEITSPRLAYDADRGVIERWRTDDYVQHVGERGFRFSGRRESLVKINGRRFNLDELDRTLQDVVPCADLACVPVEHPVSGEHIEVLVVPEWHASARHSDVAAAVLASGIGISPRNVRFVPRIERTDSGEPRRVLPAGSTDEE